MPLTDQLYRSLFWTTVRMRGESFLDDLNYLKKTQYISPDELSGLQIEKLNAILETCSSIPHYRGRVPGRIHAVEDIQHLPLLSKAEVRTAPESFILRKGRGQRFKTSGGSTGAPITLLKNSRGVAQEMAAQWRGYGWAGINVGDRQARFWGTPKSRRDKIRAKAIDFVCHRVRFTAFNYDQETFNQALGTLRRFSPSYFYGYTSIIAEFANFIKQNDIPPIPSVRSVITTAEVLDENTRRTIQESLKCRVFDEYGCGEVGTIAHECESGSLHINAENVIVEILDESGAPQTKGQPGEIVVTDLTNHTMPLIRYRLMDFGTLSLAPCACGRTLPVLEKVHGRQYDILQNRAGRKFHGEFFLYILEDARKQNLIASGIQFIQKENLDITVNLVCDEKNYPRLRKFISKRLNDDFDPKISVDYRRVETIPREKSGKIRVIKSQATPIDQNL